MDMLSAIILIGILVSVTSYISALVIGSNKGRTLLAVLLPLAASLAGVIFTISGRSLAVVIVGYVLPLIGLLIIALVTPDVEKMELDKRNMLLSQQELDRVRKSRRWPVKRKRCLF